MKLSDLFENQSLLLTLLDGLLEQGRTVYLDAHGKTTLQGRLGASRDQLTEKRRHHEGRILAVKSGNVVYDFNANRSPEDKTISNTFFILEQPADDHYTIMKHDDGTYTLVDV